MSPGQLKTKKPRELPLQGLRTENNRKRTQSMKNLAVIHNEIQTVDFHGHELALVAHNDEPYVAMRPVCDAIGLDWEGQRQRIARHPVLKTVAFVIQATGADGKNYRMLVLPLQYLNGWLFGIDASRVKRGCREDLIRYQRECFQALYDYWSQGVAINPRVTLTPAQQRALQELVAERAADVPEGLRRGAYAKLWGAVKTHFRVGTYKDLPANQFEEAKAFLEAVPLEGEWLPKKGPKRGTVIDDTSLYHIWVMSIHFEAIYDIFKKYDMYRSLTALGSKAGYEMIDRFKDGMFAGGSVRRLEPEIKAAKARLGIDWQPPRRRFAA